MFNEFHRMIIGDLDAETEQKHPGRLKIFAGVRETRARIKCASLSWHTLRAAIEGHGESGATEDEHKQD
jgi:nitrogen fixation NifU-like protein